MPLREQNYYAHIMENSSTQQKQTFLHFCSPYLNFLGQVYEVTTSLICIFENLNTLGMKKDIKKNKFFFS